MTDRPTPTADEIEGCRDNIDALLAAWGANDIEDSTLESRVFGQAVVVLDAWFADSPRDPARPDAGPVTEVRVVADSVVHGNGILQVDDQVHWVPERTVLRLAVGDEVEVTADGFERLAAAYLAALEAAQPDPAG